MSEPDLIDAAVTLHAPAGPEARIVSLVPSLTELLFDLGLGTQVVGRTHFCVHPDAAKPVPSVGGTKKIRLGRLEALRPTHVILNIDENTTDMAAAIAACVPHVIVTHPLGPRDNLGLYRLLGGIFGRAEQAEGLCRDFGRALDELEAAAGRWPRQRVLYLIWRDPWMTVSRDTYVSRTLALARWDTEPAIASVRYPPIDITRELLVRTSMVLFSSEPFAFAAPDIEAFRAEHDCAGVRLVAIDGEMVSWYGSRAIRGITYLRSLAASLATEAHARPERKP